MKQQKGVTILELMTVLIILGVLATIAIPSYREYAKRAERSEGTTALYNTAQALERCFTRFSSYNNAGCGTATQLGGAGVTTDNGKYTITGNVQPTTFALTATPSASDDAECANLTLNAAGVKGISGTGTVADCW